MNSREIFDNHKGKPISKWGHYFPMYDLYFSRFINHPVTIFEIGVWKGGSLEMWRKFFGPYSKIIGIDIDPSVKKFHDPENGYYVYVGDQSDEKILQKILDDHSNDIDIILDDGSHLPEHQIKTFEYLFPKQKNGGVYVVEDIVINPDEKLWNKENQEDFYQYINSLNHQINTLYFEEFKNFKIPNNSVLKDVNNITYFNGGICIQKGKSYENKSIRGGRFKKLREKASPILHEFNQLIKSK